MWTYLQFGEAEPHDEVGGPVGAARNSHGAGARALGEELSHDEPRDGPGTHLEHRHEPKHPRYSEVAHRRHLDLLPTKEKEEGGDGCVWDINFPDCGQRTNFRYWLGAEPTTNRREMVMIRALTAIPPNPMRCSVLRPALSTRKSWPTNKTGMGVTAGPSDIMAPKHITVDNED